MHKSLLQHNTKILPALGFTIGMVSFGLQISLHQTLQQSLWKTVRVLFHWTRGCSSQKKRPSAYLCMCASFPQENNHHKLFVFSNFQVKGGLLLKVFQTCIYFPLKNWQLCSSYIPNPKWLYKSIMICHCSGITGRFSLHFTLGWLNSPWALCEFRCGYINISLVPDLQCVCLCEREIE